MSLWSSERLKLHLLGTSHVASKMQTGMSGNTTRRAQNLTQPRPRCSTCSPSAAASSAPTALPSSISLRLVPPLLAFGVPAAAATAPRE